MNLGTILLKLLIILVVIFVFGYFIFVGGLIL